MFLIDGKNKAIIINEQHNILKSKQCDIKMKIKKRSKSFLMMTSIMKINLHKCNIKKLSKPILKWESKREVEIIN